MKKLCLFSIPVLFIAFSSFVVDDGFCVEGTCYNDEIEACDWCDNLPPGKETKYYSLINPSNSSVSFGVDGNQCVNLKLKNNNFLPVTLHTSSTPEVYMPSGWGVVVLPSASEEKSYCRFASVPVSWGWTVSTASSAALVSIVVSWNTW